MTKTQKWLLVGAFVVVLIAMPAMGFAMQTSETPAADSAKLSGKQAARRENARIIEREVYAAGFDIRVAKAAIANAIRESSLNANAIGDGGLAVGLFQVHPWGGDKETRLDPAKNARIMLQKEALSNGIHGKAFRQVLDIGGTAEDVAAAWCVHLERPSDKPGQAEVSRQIVRKLWPVAMA